MAVPIGVSVGDFIATVKLFKDIGRALRQHGGAQSHYQKTVRDLEIIQAVISRVESFESQSGDTTKINAIRGQAQLVSHEIHAFLDQIKNYRNTLGPKAPHGVRCAPLAKIKWSRRVSIRAAELSRFVDVQLRNIQVLLDLDLSESTSTSLKQHNRTAIELSLLPTRDELQTVTSLLSNDVYTVGHDTTSKITEAETAILQRLDLMKATIDTSSTDPATSTQIQELKTTLDDVLEDRSSSVNPPASARLTLTMTIPQLQISTQDKLLLLRHLFVEVNAVLLMCFAWFYLLLKDVLLVLPQVLAIIKVLHRLPQAISLVLHDNMSFEDALGRFHSLQYQQFRHWTVFESSLHCIFADLPGMQKIMRGQFVLTPEGSPTTSLTQYNYTEHVKPGFTFKMSVTIKKLILESEKCPKCCAEEVERIATCDLHCRSCGLRYLCGFIESSHSMQSREVVCVEDANTLQGSSESTIQSQNHDALPDQKDDPVAQKSQVDTLQQERLPIVQDSGQGESDDNDINDQIKNLTLDSTPQDIEEQERKLELDEMQYFKRVHIENILIDRLSEDAADAATTSDTADGSDMAKVLDTFSKALPKVTKDTSDVSNVADDGLFKSLGPYYKYPQLNSRKKQSPTYRERHPDNVVDVYVERPRSRRHNRYNAISYPFQPQLNTIGEDVSSRGSFTNYPSRRNFDFDATEARYKAQEKAAKEYIQRRNEEARRAIARSSSTV